MPGPAAARSAPRSRGSQRARVCAMPVALGALLASGLVSALVADGWGDAWAWFALGLPVAVMTWFSLRRGGRRAGHGPTDMHIKGEP